MHIVAHIPLGLCSHALWFFMFSTAYDVTLNDDSWSQDIFDVVTGNTSMSWERLDA